MAGALAIALALQRQAPQAAIPAEMTGDRLFDLAHVWRVHLSFTAAQWDAMEPKGGPGFPGGPPGPGGPPSFGGPGGPPGPGGPAGFGPGTFTAPVFRKQGDANHDGRVSRDEFTALGETWFSAWDKGGTGSLGAEHLRDGLNLAMAMPAPGGAPGAPGAPPPAAPGLSFQGAEGKRNGIVSVMGTDFASVRADLSFEGLAIPDVSVRYKGNGTFLQSRSSLKRSLKVDLNDGFRGRRLGGVTKLNFHSNVTDAGCMNEVLAYSLYRAAGVPAPRTAYARVSVTVPGKHDRQYLGLYSLVENPDNAFALDRFGTRKGAVFKPVPRRLFEDLGDDWAAYRQAYDPKTPVSPEETQRLIAFCRLVSHADDAEFAAQMEDFLDVEEFASFMAVTAWLSTLDSLLAMGQNYILYLHPKTHRFMFIPWDLDHSFGQFFPIGTPEQRENLSIRKPWAGDNLFLERVFRVERFRLLYLARMKELSQSIFRPERIQRAVDDLAAVLRPGVVEESADQAARFERAVAGEPAAPAGFGGPTPGPPGQGPGGPGQPGRGAATPPGPMGAGGPGFGPPGFAMPAVKPIRGFVVARAASVGEQLAGRAEGMTVSPFGVGGPGAAPLPKGFGPGMFIGPVFLAQFDADRNGEVSRAEFAAGFTRWFADWDAAQEGALTEEQLRTGLNRALDPFRTALPGAPGPFGGSGPVPLPGPAVSLPGPVPPPANGTVPANPVP